jgi:hypothetical protein
MFCQIISIKKNILYIILSGILFIGLSCCIDDSCSSCQDSLASESFDYQMPADGIEKFGIKGVNGSIEIIGHAGTDSIRVWGEKMIRSSSEPDAELRLNDLEVMIQNNNNQMSVETKQPSQSNGRSYEVDYHIIVPNRLKVKVESVIGEIHILDIQNDIESELVNGNIGIQNNQGSCRCALVNGQIESQLTLGNSDVCILSSVNGNIILNVPDTTSAMIEASVSIGSISFSGLQIQNLNTTKTTASGTLGRGTGFIQVSTVNGNIEVSGY